MTAHVTHDSRQETDAPVDIEAMVVPDPNRPGPDRWRIVNTGPSVWAIVQHMIAKGNIDDPTLASDGLIAQTAADYEITEVAVRAALAYYEKNRAAIDTRLAINAEGASRRR